MSSYPVRCFSCGKVIAHKFESFMQYKNENKDLNKFFIDNGIMRYCCKRMFMGFSPIEEKILHIHTLQQKST